MTEQKTERSFGQLLQQALLEKKHLTARDLARSANVSEAVYRGWEVDKGHPNRLQLSKMLGSGHWLHAHLPKKVLTTSPETAALPAADARIGYNIAATFGAALQAERKLEGLDQDDLGALLDPPVTGQAVSAWETNTSTPVLVNLEQLYELFPNLALAPKPRSQDIPVPNGGKGSFRGGSPSSPTLTWTQPTLLEAAPLRPEPPAGAPALYTFTPVETMPTTPAPSSTPVFQDSQLIVYVHALCSKLHGGEWGVRFFTKEGAWHAVAEAHTDAFLAYTGVAKEGGTPHEALVNLLRDARKELERRRKMLDDLERDLPKDAL